MSRLSWTGPGLKPATFDLTGDSVRIGRREDNDLVLPYGYVSGEHAELTAVDGIWSVRDLGSTNGTLVNGNPADSVPLKSGDKISLGSLDLRFTTEAHASVDVVQPIPDADLDPEAFATLASLTPADASELEKLSLLLDLQVQWGDGINSDATIHRILQSALTVSGAERACLLLADGDAFVYSAGRNNRGEVLAEQHFQASRSVVQEVVRRAEAVFMTQGLEGDLAEQKSVVAMNLRAVGCMPLRRREAETDEYLGILYLDSHGAMHMLSGLDERILLKLAGEAEAVLERMELIGVREERQRLEREMELARQTQESLLPARIPEIHGWALEAFCRPTRHVGGDFYDFIPGPDGRLAAMIADVSGKGVAASLLSSSVQGALQMMLREGRPLSEAFRRVNDYLCERSQEGRFVTVFSALLSSEGEVCWANAGHNPAFLYRAATRVSEELGASGMILGSLPTEEFGLTHAEHSTRLVTGDLLLIYSDGLTEATGPGNALFGEERVLKILHDHGHRGSREVRQRLLEALEEFTRGEEQSDDITLVLAERRG